MTNFEAVLREAGEHQGPHSSIISLDGHGRDRRNLGMLSQLVSLLDEKNEQRAILRARMIAWVVDHIDVETAKKLATAFPVPE